MGVPVAKKKWLKTACCKILCNALPNNKTKSKLPETSDANGQHIYVFVNPGNE